MLKLLVAEQSGLLAERVSLFFHNDFEIMSCTDGISAMQLIETCCPDILLIQLSIPLLDGFSVVKQIPQQCKPKIIIGIADYISNALLGIAETLEFTTLYNTSCDTGSMLTFLKTASQNIDVLCADKRNRILSNLGINECRLSGKQLLYAIEVYSTDIHQSISKELLPAVAEKFDTCTRTVEYNLRKGISDAWKHGDRNTWNKFFPNAEKAPPTKEFLAKISFILPK